MARYSLPPYTDRCPAPYLSVDIVLLTVENGVLKVLMVNWYDLPGSDLALPHEIVFEDVALEEIAEAHLQRQLGLHGIELEQAGVCSDPDRDHRGRVVSVAFVGLVEAGQLRDVVRTHEGCHLVTVRLDANDGTAELQLAGRMVLEAFDHAAIIAKAVEVVREHIDTSLHPFRLLPSTFTMLELQRVHEAFLGHSLDKPAFRKRMLGRTFPGNFELVKTARVKAGAHRPASLYRLA